MIYDITCNNHNYKLYNVYSDLRGLILRVTEYNEVPTN